MKKGICMILALLLTASANLHVCARLSADSGAVSELFSMGAVVRGLRAAEAAAAELSDGLGAPPGLKASLVLSLPPPSDAAGGVSDFLLRQTPGVALRAACRVNGLYIGCTAEEDKLREALRRHIFGTRPPGAVSGRYTEEIEIRPVYTRPGRESTAEDLCMLVTGLVPVMYTDGEGKVIAG
ncbi:MAG: hypothetical protein IJL51_05650 [Oscillospiraceae bacterium]|nr:hypothetical protein [Oscillospiraceae bacterium]